ncbi:MAG: RNA-directed DNA polymerase [Acidobacteria bacterium]|nr:RNA-directed DNA polymerase [Acidobacteriota bacterium]
MTLGRPWRWLRPLGQRYLARFSQGTRPRTAGVVDFLLQDPGFRRAAQRHARSLDVANWLCEPRQMQPVGKAAGWDIPTIETVTDLASWLEIPLDALNSAAVPFATSHHYHYRLLSKQSGMLRLIEAPKPRLKALQRRIAAGILDCIPLHPAVHGFRHGHSIKTFAAPHAGQRVVLRMDLRDFFPTITRARVQAFFRTAGYPEAVADMLGILCTNSTPGSIWKPADPKLVPEMRALHRTPHLPQGAPTSPALANLCAYRFDCRLSGLALASGAFYTRYADDLAFSGDTDFERSVDRFTTHAAAILMDEGFSVHHRKTRVMRRGVRQHLAGLVTNDIPNIYRGDYDRLKAILTNCLRHGPASQNRNGHPDFRAHLDGRISFVEMINPSKARKLRALFHQINWA